MIWSAASTAATEAGARLAEKTKGRAVCFR
jgi:hypothetical protein